MSALLQWWCTRGGLVTVVDAADEPSAAALADRAFRHGRVRRSDPGSIACRPADAADLALWAVLLGQHAGGIDGARCVPSPDLPSIEEPSLFGGGA